MLRAGAIVVPERRAHAGHPNSKQSVELLSRAAKARIFRQSCAAPVQQCQDLGISHGQNLNGSGCTATSVVHPKFVIGAGTASATAWSAGGTSGLESWGCHHGKVEHPPAEERCKKKQAQTMTSQKQIFSASVRTPANEHLHDLDTVARRLNVSTKIVRRRSFGASLASTRWVASSVSSASIGISLRVKRDHWPRRLIDRT